jgi:hypothetical protein
MKKSNHLSKFNMKKVIKSGIVVALSAIMIMSQVAPMSFADGENGKNQQKIEKKTDKKEYDPKVKAQLFEQLQIMYRFGDDGQWANLPSGMFKQGYLNYGLAKRYFNGQFPAGLAKKMKDFQYGDHHSVQSIEDLNKLIVSAKTKLASTKEYYNVPNEKTAKELLQAAIKKAEDFVAAYVPTQVKDIKAQYEALKKAMVTFDNSEIVSGDYITNLNALLTKLNVYKSTYYSRLSTEKKASLDALILNIQQYTTTVPAKVLTLGAYNDIMMESKKYEDHISKLDNLIAEVEAFIYVNPNATEKVLKVVEGPISGVYTAGQYTSGSIIKITEAVKVAKDFRTANLTASASQIDSQFNLLNTAFSAFKGEIVLGADQISVLTLLHGELYQLSLKTPSVALTALMTEMKVIIDAPTVNPLTKTKLAYFMDASKNYIKDLYDPLKVELSAKIVAANAVWAVEAKVDATDEKAALLTTITAAQTYLIGTTHTFANFYVHINALQAAMTAYINANL